MSHCVLLTTFVADSIPPSLPIFTSSNPVSPGFSSTPTLFGTSEAGSVVRIFADASCTSVLTQGTAELFAATGFTVSAPSMNPPIATLYYANAKSDRDKDGTACEVSR